MIVISICKIQNLHFIIIDIGNAFLEGEIDYENYMYLPNDLSLFISGGDKNKKYRVKLKKSLYGIKQAAKVFNDTLNEHLINIGWKRLANDVCFYIYKYNDDLYLLITHIDDIIMCGKEKDVIDQLTEEIKSGFKKITTNDDVKQYLGINLYHDDNVLHLSQQNYINEFINEIFINNELKGSPIPMTPTVNFRVLKKDETNESILPILGKIRYVADKTRPDILFATNLLCTKALNPPIEFMQGTIKLLKYLKDSSSDTLKLGGDDKEIKLFAFSDASYVTDSDSKSQLGNCFYLSKDSGAIYSVSKKDNTVSHSSTEAEIKAIDMCLRTVLYLRNMLEELNLKQNSPTTIYVDNKSAKELVETLKSNHKTKHINMRINFIREQINERNIVIKFVRTHDQVADILTKALPRNDFIRLKKLLLYGFNNDLSFIED
jgi:hypothetical protein